MMIDLKKIIPMEELQTDFSLVSEKLNEIGVGFVFQRNSPTHVIMTLEHYENLLNNSTAINEENEDGNLEILLNNIGKKVFVEFYEVFKEDKNPEESLPETFSLNSKRTRASNARKIFKNQLQVEALKNIMNSSKLDDKTIEKASRILNDETSDNVVDLEIGCEADHKIGKAVRNFMSMAIPKGLLSLEELKDMEDPEFSKETFNMNFPVLKKYDPNLPLNDQKRDRHGNNRYYNALINFKTERFFLCSQWVESLHRESFEKWLKDKMFLELERKANRLNPGTSFTVKGLLSDYWDSISYSSRLILGKTFFQYVGRGGIQNVQSRDKHDGIQVYEKI